MQSLRALTVITVSSLALSGLALANDDDSSDLAHIARDAQSLPRTDQQNIVSGMKETLRGRKIYER